MSSIPPIRPRGIIGRTEADGVRITSQFLRWLEAVRNAVSETAAVPPGTLRVSLSGTEPSGWKVLNGQALSKTDYAALYSLIGDTYGATATTFNLPDASDRVLIGSGAIALAQFGGASSVTLTVDQLPAHGHPVTDPGHTHAVTDPGHTHTVTDPGHTHQAAEAAGSADAVSGGDVTSATTGATGSATTGVAVDSATTGIGMTNAQTGVTVGEAGGGQPINITPLGIGVSVMVKT